MQNFHFHAERGVNFQLNFAPGHADPDPDLTFQINAGSLFFMGINCNYCECIFPIGSIEAMLGI
jgi:hypothetical protein